MNQFGNYERRAFEVPDIEIRQEGDTLHVRGLIVPFGKKSQDLGGFTEDFRSIEPNNGGVFLLWSHQFSEPALASSRGKPPMEITVDERGLSIHAVNPNMNAQQIRAVQETTPHASFGFDQEKDVVITGEPGKRHRSVGTARLVEASIGVLFPAYQQTRVSVAQRSLLEFDERELEQRVELEQEQLRLRMALAERA